MNAGLLIVGINTENSRPWESHCNLQECGMDEEHCACCSTVLFAEYKKYFSIVLDGHYKMACFVAYIDQAGL